ncbi:hypothetical protein KC19_7G014500 [Ceratodon purpureus]|uniref:Uncharacterized protein n=1 Tax=Ceratodon purpureus TaxID=3225 RepID=A0A8T0H4W6_CERPU|nr:hypothetical protein KC19_7G014500 [Ceratodon purpureus]
MKLLLAKRCLKKRWQELVHSTLFKLPTSQSTDALIAESASSEMHEIDRAFNLRLNQMICTHYKRTRVKSLFRSISTHHCTSSLSNSILQAVSITYPKLHLHISKLKLNLDRIVCRSKIMQG